MIRERPAACLLAAFLCALIGFAWQALTVHYNDGGNWTALFVAGSVYPYPPALASENIYVLPNSGGYDGQMYHYVAHDPLLRHGFGKYLDGARLRYHRILLPGLAYLVAGGRQDLIDTSYIFCNLAFLFLGAWWLSQYLVLSGRNPALAILFVLTPVALISLDRLTVDLSFTALCIGFAYYARTDSRWQLFAVMALALMSRETGIALIFGYCVSLLFKKQFARAVLYATTVVPAGLWYLFINSKTAPTIVQLETLTPLKGILDSFLHPVSYPFSPLVNSVIQATDFLALLGLVLAIVLAFYLLYKNRAGYLALAAATWALGALFLPKESWQDCCFSGRVFAPMLIFVALRAVEHFAFLWVLPLLLISLREWLQLLSPLLGILKGLLHKH